MDGYQSERVDFPAVERRNSRIFNRGYLSVRISPETADKLSDIEKLLAKAVIVKDSRGTTAGVAESEIGPIFIKRYNPHTILRRIRQLFDEPRPLKVRKATHALENIVPVPELFLAYTEKCGIFSRRHAIITEAYAEPLTVAEQMETVTAAENFPTFVATLTEMVNKIHNAGVLHGDLKLQNILCRFHNGTFLLGVFDFDGTKIFSHPIQSKNRHKEWARIISSFLRVCRVKNIEIDSAAVTNAFFFSAGNLNRKMLNAQLAKFTKKENRKK